jgi:hypothetical protein
LLIKKPKKKNYLSQIVPNYTQKKKSLVTRQLLPREEFIYKKKRIKNKDNFNDEAPQCKNERNLFLKEKKGENYQG